MVYHELHESMITILFTFLLEAKVHMDTEFEHDHFQRCTRKSKGVALLNVTMLESYWTLLGLNLFAYSSDLGQTRISIDKGNDQEHQGLIYFS